MRASGIERLKRGSLIAAIVLIYLLGAGYAATRAGARYDSPADCPEPTFSEEMSVRDAKAAIQAHNNCETDRNDQGIVVFMSGAFWPIYLPVSLGKEWAEDEATNDDGGE